MRIKNCFILFITVSLLGLSCNKDSPCEPYSSTIPVSESLYPFLFDSTSQWRYVEINSNKVDNIEVVYFEYKSDIWHAYGPGGNCPQGTLIFFYKIYFESDELGEFMWYVGLHEISMLLHYGGVLYFTSFENGNQYYNTTMDGVIDTLRINNVLYSNVVKMKIEEDIQFEYDMNLYWVDSIGIIRKEIKKNNNIIETWDLQSYDVNLYVPE